ncbi:MAG: heavy-metal-associated domain-containing protein [Methanosphaera sp.]|uniref:heavy-metal-associated domain-containing protein n=1 Tax=Methanosphaera sp. TaxID=2666342 RepID=UPI0025CF2AD1|nr:heavy-metal-associated domain-containing protein [Methanosphaera sp.]MCI5867521.1 heavy-metal-associated domain-containing protein [Methanosphaera sp.]MDD6533988.1 heavy-metal-associated domain-containing protein [Methanosphaera sp.]MDY3956202.1 heavy-metal-associated domain-containing protein [Methanosphaera sp.]
MAQKTETFKVEDMMCDACINTITKTLTNNENIESVNCDLQTKNVDVTYDDENVDAEEIISTLDMVGFPATIKKKL